MTIMRVYAAGVLQPEIDSMIKAIRSDPLVGRGSGSSIDETIDDEDLREFLSEFPEDNITDPTAAVKWARELEFLWLDQATNASSGEPDCPLIAAYERFEKLMEEIPVNTDRTKEESDRALSEAYARFEKLKAPSKRDYGWEELKEDYEREQEEQEDEEHWDMRHLKPHPKPHPDDGSLLD
jgi:hypothetical protein